MPTESQSITDRAMADIVNAFLKWPLPSSVCSDRCAMMPGTKHRSGTNLLTCPETVEMAQEVVRPVVERLLEEHADTHTIRQRDEAEEAADKLASTILGEPIDWPDHGAKWDEALELVSAERARIETLAAKMKKFVAENYPADGNGQVDFVRVLVEGYADELLSRES